MAAGYFSFVTSLFTSSHLLIIPLLLATAFLPAEASSALHACYWRLSVSVVSTMDELKARSFSGLGKISNV